MYMSKPIIAQTLPQGNLQQAESRAKFARRLQFIRDQRCLHGQHMKYISRSVCVNCGLVLGKQHNKGDE